MRRRSFLSGGDCSPSPAAYPQARASSPYPGERESPPARRDACLCGVAPDGVCLSHTRYRVRGGLLPRRFTLAVDLSCEHANDGGLFSVALSSAFPSPGVTRHRALWSSDFPPVRKRTDDHPSGVDGGECAPTQLSAQAGRARPLRLPRPYECEARNKRRHQESVASRTEEHGVHCNRRQDHGRSSQNDRGRSA